MKLTLVKTFILGLLFLAQHTYAEEKVFDLKKQSEILNKAKSVSVYWGLSGPKGGSNSPYANNRELNRANPTDETELKEWSCAYRVENTKSISDLTNILLTKTDWLQALHLPHLVLPLTMKYTKKNGGMTYEKFSGEHLVIDYIFADETQARFLLGNSGDGMLFFAQPHSSDEVRTYEFYNPKHGHSLGTRFFEWLRLNGGKPSVGDTQRLTVQDCEFWQRRAIYRSWDGNGFF